MITQVTKKNDLYTYRITWSDEDKQYVGLCVEFPSLSWLADSKEEALRGISDVVSHAISDMESNGENPPKPLSTRNYSGKFTVRIPSDIHKRLATQAAESKVSFNRYISAILAAECR
jgi:predicted HicB family RNase H-like nuclease